MYEKAAREKEKAEYVPWNEKKKISGMKSVNPKERDNMESHDQLFNMMLC